MVIHPAPRAPLERLLIVGLSSPLQLSSPFPPFSEDTCLFHQERLAPVHKGQFLCCLHYLCPECNSQLGIGLSISFSAEKKEQENYQISYCICVGELKPSADIQSEFWQVQPFCLWIWWPSSSYLNTVGTTKFYPCEDPSHLREQPVPQVWCSGAHQQIRLGVLSQQPC